MLIAADFGGGSVQQTGHASSMTIDVDPDRLYATAHAFDATADKLIDWTVNGAQHLAVQSAGADSVSTGVADFFNGVAQDSDGAVARVNEAASNLYEVAKTMRAAAVSYGLTDTENAADLATQKS